MALLSRRSSLSVPWQRYAHASIRPYDSIHGVMVHRHVQGGAELLRVDMHGGVTGLWTFKGPRGTGIPSPDGRHLAITDYLQDSNIWMMEDF